MLIDQTSCIGCGNCVSDCLRGLIQLRDGKAAYQEGDCMECGHCVAICPVGAIAFPGRDLKEVRTYDPASFDVPAETLMNFMEFRRSVRKFNSQPLENGTIAQLIHAAQCAPSAVNARRYRFVVIREQIKSVTEKAMLRLRDMAIHMDESNAPQSALVYREKWLNLYRDYQETGYDGLFYNAPCLILTITSSEDVSALLDCGLVSANMELMANALGLGACYIGFFSRAVGMDQTLADMVGIKEHERLISTLALGYPDVRYHRTANRKPANVTFL